MWRRESLFYFCQCPKLIYTSTEKIFLLFVKMQIVDFLLIFMNSKYLQIPQPLKCKSGISPKECILKNTFIHFIFKNYYYYIKKKSGHARQHVVSSLAKD